MTDDPENVSPGSDYGFKGKSFDSNPMRGILVFLTILVIIVWTVFLSPDQAGILPAPFRRELQIDFVNVGQGDCILVRTPKGRNYLIDGGINVPPGQARRENRELAYDFLRKKGITRLDGVVVTHPHNDHLGGLIPVLRTYPIGYLLECGAVFNTATFEDMKAICEKRRIKRVAPEPGEVLDWGDELFVQVLHPEKVDKSEEFSALNNMSIVLQIRYGKVSVMLSGDIETEAEQEVMRYGTGIRSQILKLPHHGSDTSIHEPFIKMVNPADGVIQVGKGNPFGHPKAKALDLYRSLGIPLLRTDRNGNISLRIGGKDPKDYSFEVDHEV